MPVLYDIGIAAYHAGIRVFAGWNPKARAWVSGREGVWQRLEARSAELKGCLWMHCASVGEFEQGRPVLEAIKAEHPALPVLLTFFSPSGYEARKNEPLATHVELLPMDSARNAARLAALLQPRLALFVKYEFWFHHLRELERRHIPLFLVSGIFRAKQPFFRWYGTAWRRMLRCYTHLFVQDEGSRALLASTGVTNVTVSGDTRFDRVTAIMNAAHAARDPESVDLQQRMEAFRAAGSTAVLVCGSTWPKDIEVIAGAAKDMRVPSRRVAVPHELGERNVRNTVEALPGPVLLWSSMALEDPAFGAVNDLVVDRMGLLARIYAYGEVAYVGGGFGDGIHNLLEAAVWGRPVLFGPAHRKFAEAQGLIDAGGGYEVRNAADLRNVLDRLLGDAAVLRAASEAAARYVRERLGATSRISEVVLRSM